MNIFVIDYHPGLAAMDHNDRHVVKMILESAQILSTALFLNGIKPAFPIYKPTHLSHPCVRWARENPLHFSWLCELALELCYEYRERYGKTHKTHDLIYRIYDTFGIEVNDYPKTWALAMPDKYKSDDVVQSYRAYYIGEKQHLAKWTKTPVPAWYVVSKAA